MTTSSAAPQTGPSSPRNAFGALLGMQTVHAGPGGADVRLQVHPTHLNDVGIVHGGVVFALADQAVAVAANTGDRVAVASTFTIHFLKAAHEGDELIARARPVRIGRTVSVYNVEIRLGDTVVATALAQAIEPRSAAIPPRA